MTEEKREKVIRGLECIAGNLVYCTHCKYSDANGYGRGDRCKRDCAKDALALLKAQEPVKPIVGHNIGPTWWYACGECKGAIDIGDKFCRHCGRTLKWES